MKGGNMKKHTLINIIVIVFLMSFHTIAGASDQKKAMDHSKHLGEKIHESKVDNYVLAYHVLDLPGTDAKHLMTYITDIHGNAISEAKVGYLIKGPGGTTQKIMAMAMKDAFGGNANLSIKGIYKIKTKVVVKGKKLMDQFTHEVK